MAKKFEDYDLEGIGFTKEGNKYWAYDDLTREMLEFIVAYYTPKYISWQEGDEGLLTYEKCDGLYLDVAGRLCSKNKDGEDSTLTHDSYVSGTFERDCCNIRSHRDGSIYHVFFYLNYPEINIDPINSQIDNIFPIYMKSTNRQEAEKALKALSQKILDYLK